MEAYQNKLRILEDGLSSLILDLKERRKELEIDLTIALKVEHSYEAQIIRVELEPLINTIDAIQQIHYNITKTDVDNRTK